MSSSWDWSEVISSPARLAASEAAFPSHLKMSMSWTRHVERGVDRFEPPAQVCDLFPRHVMGIHFGGNRRFEDRHLAAQSFRFPQLEQASGALVQCPGHRLGE